MAANLLTDKAIRNAKATDREIILRDGGGLELRIYRNGLKAWQYRYQFQGKRRVLRLKNGESPADYPDVSLAEARDLASEQRKILSRGVDPVAYAEEQRQERERQRLAEEEAARIALMEQAARRSFEEVFHQWYETKLSKRKDGADLLRAVRKDIFPAVGNIEMGKVTRGHLMACLDRIAARAPRMANRLLTTLKTFLSWAVMREIVPDNPLAPVKTADVGGKQPARERFLKDDEIIELRDALPKANLPRTTELALWVCLATGCRLGELTNAEWAHINLETRRWRIPAANTKNGHEHIIALSTFALRHFRELSSLTGWSRWVIPSPRKEDAPITRLNISTQVGDRMGGNQRQSRTKHTSSLLLSGGRWTPHDLRRSCATGMSAIGINPAVIEAVLNHRDDSSLKAIYQRYDFGPEAAAAWQAWGEHLDELLYGNVIPLQATVRAKA